MNLLREVFLIILFIFLRLLCPAENLSFSKLSVENGLSNNLVNEIYKDSYGFIWFGTLEGLDRYDGVEIRPFSSKFPETVENVFSITEDLGKHLWVGTATGLFRYNCHIDKFERVDLDNANIKVHSLAIMPDSSLCVGTSNGLYFVNTRTLKPEHVVLSDTKNKRSIDITGIFPDNHGNCWLSSSTGLIRYSLINKKSDNYLFKNLPEEEYNSFTSICCIGNKLYLGTSNQGIVEFDLQSKSFSSGINIDNKIICSISSDNRERLFVCTDGGGLKVINVRTQKVENIEKQENDPVSISSNSIYSFYLDERGRYWLGTYSGGVCYSRSVAGIFKLHSVTTAYPEANKSIRSFYFAPDGTQYFGTRDGFIQIGKNSTAKFFHSDPNDKSGLRSNIILSVFPFMGDILFGTYGGGISRFSVSEQRIKPFLDSDIFSSGNTYSFATDGSGNLWIATFKGIYKYSPTDKSVFNFNKQNTDLVSDEIFRLTFDSKGRLWVGSMAGTSVLVPKGRNLERIDLPKTFINTFKTNYIYEDQADNIWVCTERGGLVSLDPTLNNCKTYHVADGLPDNSVCAIIESSTGEYWISTLKGFCKFSSQTQKFSKFTLSDGLPSLAFTPASTHLSIDGTLYFGNEKGLVYFNPAEVAETGTNSKIRLTDFYLFGKSVQPGPESVLQKSIETTDEINLNDRFNSVGFRFVAFNYNDPSDNNYQYKLEGFDKEWRNNGSNNTVYYEKLNPGSYIFRVKNGNDAGEGTSNDLAIKITISHFWAKSPFFILFLILLVFTGVYLVMKYIQKLQKVGKLSIVPPKVEKYKGVKIPQNESTRIIKELVKCMEDKKPYLNAELKLADLANEINYPLHEISQVLNQDLNQSFYDFVNKYRIEEVKKRMADKAFEKFTFIAIAEQCGFNSKTSFYRIFKNETGKTPADYLKEIKESQKLT